MRSSGFRDDPDDGVGGAGGQRVAGGLVGVADAEQEEDVVPGRAGLQLGQLARRPPQGGHHVLERNARPALDRAQVGAQFTAVGGARAPRGVGSVMEFPSHWVTPGVGFCRKGTAINGCADAPARCCPWAEWCLTRTRSTRWRASWAFRVNWCVVWGGPPGFRGGGRVRNLVDADLRLVADLLEQGSYTEQVGARLFSVAAELGRVAGWSNFDAHRRRPGRRREHPEVHEPPTRRGAEAGRGAGCRHGCPRQRKAGTAARCRHDDRAGSAEAR